MAGLWSAVWNWQNVHPYPDWLWHFRHGRCGRTQLCAWWADWRGNIDMEACSGGVVSPTDRISAGKMKSGATISVCMKKEG